MEALLKSLPSNITAQDASDFIQLASYYSDKTPQSIREDFHYKIFGANYDDEVGEFTITKLMCLPITIHEITRKDRGSPLKSSTISYFIIDTRSQEAFNNGHIYGSFNLDCKLSVDNPSQFDIALNSLEAFKSAQKFDEHLCLLGYGDDAQVKDYMYPVNVTSGHVPQHDTCASFAEQNCPCFDGTRRIQRTSSIPGRC